jgi:hypothetical protein
MNKKISSLSIVFFCLFSSSYASNLELPEITQNMGMKTIKIWLWELDPSVDDRDDIENYIISTIESVGYKSDLLLVLSWLDSNYKNYQHFDDVIHKIDDSDNQLDGFLDYIQKNYKFKNNDHHILMTESGWDDSIDGKTYRNSHFSIASDNSEATAAHELGHMLGAKHNSSFSFWNWTASIMKQSSIFNRAGEFWSNDNINAVRKSFDIFLNFPESKQISFASNSYLTVDSTNNAPKYDMLGKWNENKAIVYKLPVNPNFKYTIEIEKADFDTYLYIYDGKGNEINQNDDNVGSSKSKLSSLSFNSHREVYIVVTGFRNQHGNFTLRVEKE